MIPYFEFKGLNSYEDFGIIITKTPSSILPQRNVKYEEIKGRNGSLTFDDGTYKDINISVECGFVSKQFAEKANEIKAWLSGEFGDLIFSMEDDKKYIAQVVNKVDIKESIRNIGEFIIIFNCKPFKYSLLENTIVLKNNESIVNMGTFYSEPKLKIYGAGNVSVTINDNTFYIKDLNEYIYVDSEIEECFMENQLLNNKMVGEFPILQRGNNKIDISDNIDKIEITPRWRWL